MMKKHKIGWLNVPGYVPETWNPIVGCSKVSTGCENCYAEKMAGRLASMERAGNHAEAFICYRAATHEQGGWKGTIHLVESALEKPLRWRKPRAIFVNSMGDLFHEDTSDEWIDQVFAVAALCPQHIFVMLTKRAERMERYMTSDPAYGVAETTLAYETSHRVDNDDDPNGTAAWHEETGRLEDGMENLHQWKRGTPLPNVWLGVTVENADHIDRVDLLREVPAAVRFLSLEPLLGPIPSLNLDKIDWVICGGESGSGARAMNPEWARSLRDQCEEASVPFFFKRWGDGVKRGWQFSTPWTKAGFDRAEKHGGDVLDGRRHHEFPTLGKPSN